MTPSERIEALEKALAATTQGALTLIRYEHGGGRLYLPGESGERELVADFYHEGDREAFMAVSAAMPWLLSVARAAVAWREMLKDDETELVRIFGHDELTAIMDAVDGDEPGREV